MQESVWFLSPLLTVPSLDSTKTLVSGWKTNLFRRLETLVSTRETNLSPVKTLLPSRESREQAVFNLWVLNVWIQSLLWGKEDAFKVVVWHFASQRRESCLPCPHHGPVALAQSGLFATIPWLLQKSPRCWQSTSAIHSNYKYVNIYCQARMPRNFRSYQYGNQPLYIQIRFPTRNMFSDFLKSLHKAVSLLKRCEDCKDAITGKLQQVYTLSIGLKKYCECTWTLNLASKGLGRTSMLRPNVKAVPKQFNEFWIKMNWHESTTYQHPKQSATQKQGISGENPMATLFVLKWHTEFDKLE